MDVAYAAPFAVIHSHPFIHGILLRIIRYAVENLALFTMGHI